jgi:hypothetical protein
MAPLLIVKTANDHGDAVPEPAADRGARAGARCSLPGRQRARGDPRALRAEGRVMDPVDRDLNAYLAEQWQAE